jgi:hypothetical protein
MNKKCKTCKFWEQDAEEKSLGSCKHNAPNPGFPVMMATDWCGAHEPRDTWVKPVEEPRQNSKQARRAPKKVGPIDEYRVVGKKAKTYRPGVNLELLKEVTCPELVEEFRIVRSISGSQDWDDLVELMDQGYLKCEREDELCRFRLTEKGHEILRDGR